MNGCLLPALFAAQHGVGVPLKLHVPLGMQPITMAWVPPPDSDKVVLGEPLANRLDTSNFSVQWSDPTVGERAAEVTAEALELAWEVLVVDEGLGPPKTADWAKILVFLDPDLSGTGVTTGVETDTNPDGAPIIYLNPNYIDQPDFFRSLAAHEFGHAIQFQYRDWYGASDSEPWFWEATSEWMAEVVNSDWNQYAWSSSWYASAPGLAFDSMEGFHQYGMMLLNAYIDEYRGGSQTVWSIWTSNEGMAWLDEIERTLQEPAIDTWGEFVGAYAAQGFVDSEYYETPVLGSQTGEIPGQLGSVYLDLGQARGVVELSNGVGTMVRDGDWFVFDESAVIPNGVGSVGLVVTNPGTRPLQYSVTVNEDLNDDDASNSAEPSAELSSDSDVDGSGGSKSGCGCATGPDLTRSWSVALFALLCGFRYRSWSRGEFRRR